MFEGVGGGGRLGEVSEPTIILLLNIVVFRIVNIYSYIRSAGG